MADPPHAPRGPRVWQGAKLEDQGPRGGRGSSSWQKICRDYAYLQRDCDNEPPSPVYTEYSLSFDSRDFCRAYYNESVEKGLAEKEMQRIAEEKQMDNRNEACVRIFEHFHKQNFTSDAGYLVEDVIDRDVEEIMIKYSVVFTKGNVLGLLREREDLFHVFSVDPLNFHVNGSYTLRNGKMKQPRFKKTTLVRMVLP